MSVQIVIKAVTSTTEQKEEKERAEFRQSGGEGACPECGEEEGADHGDRHRWVQPVNV